MCTKDKLKYKRHLGTIQFSENDNCFYDKVVRMQRTCMENHGTSIDAFVGDLIEKHFELRFDIPHLFA